MQKNIKMRIAIGKTLQVLLWILGIFFMLFSLFTVTTFKSDETINHSYSMLDDFIRESDYVQKNHLDVNNSTILADNYEVTSRNKFDGHAYDFNDEFNPPLTDKFVLKKWRGEWNEYYSFPSGTTSLSFNIDDYYIVNPYFDSLFSLGIAIGCFLILFFVFRKNRNHQRITV